MAITVDSSSPAFEAMIKSVALFEKEI